MVVVEPFLAQLGLLQGTLEKVLTEYVVPCFSDLHGTEEGGGDHVQHFETELSLNESLLVNATLASDTNPRKRQIQQQQPLITPCSCELISIKVLKCVSEYL